MPSSQFIDSIDLLVGLIDNLNRLPTNSPSLYIDLEGKKLSRHGTISILQLFVTPLNVIYLIDVFKLGASTFQTAGREGKTFKQILEAPEIPKIIFDVRRDSDALYAHYGIKLAGVQDLQLMALATRMGPKKYLDGLSTCVEEDAGLPWNEKANFRAVKERGRKLFAPEKGGSYEVFEARPLLQEIKDYCVQDVSYMPKLRSVYAARLTSAWAIRVDVATKERIDESMSENFNGDGPHMKFGPRSWW